MACSIFSSNFVTIFAPLNVLYCIICFWFVLYYFLVMNMDCIFCKIVNGEIPSYTIYEDEIVKVFLDVNPQNLGHMLIVPKIHTLDLNTIDINVITHVMVIAKQMKQLVEDKLHADGVTLLQNNGIAQDVKHFHLHIIPKYSVVQANLPVNEVFQILKESL